MTVPLNGAIDRADGVLDAYEPVSQADPLAWQFDCAGRHWPSPRATENTNVDSDLIE
jgi:hypothetical protein